MMLSVPMSCEHDSSAKLTASSQERDFKAPVAAFYNSDIADQIDIKQEFQVILCLVDIGHEMMLVSRCGQRYERQMMGKHGRILRQDSECLADMPSPAHSGR